ncbi:MAG: recombinase family protein [Ilumatobacteraceae bacterium]
MKKTNPYKQAIAYYWDNHPLTLTRQARLCREFAESLDAYIVEEYMDIGAERTQLKRLIDRIQQHQVDYVMVSSLTALGEGKQRVETQDRIMLTGTKLAVVGIDAVFEIKDGRSDRPESATSTKGGQT